MKIAKSPTKSFSFDFSNKLEISNDNIYNKQKFGIENINILPIMDEIHINKNEDIDNNHLIKSFNENKLINKFILISLPLIILSELFYRNSLYSYSVELGLTIQNYINGYYQYAIIVITKGGCEIFIFFSLIFIFFNFSLIHFFIFLFGIIICVYIQSLMKIIYGNFRPFIDNKDLFKGICDGGFGNPSGHSLVCCFMYPILIHYIIYNKESVSNIFLRIFVHIFFSLILFTVLLSRFLLGLHSLNQIIYGSFLGFWIFVVMIYTFKLQKISMITYRKIYQNIRYIYIINLVLLILVIIPIICCHLFNQNLDYISLNKKIDYNCPNVEVYRRFNYDGVFGCLIIFGLIGFYYGQFIFWCLFDKYYKKNMDRLNNDYYLIDELINNWNKNKILLFQNKKNIYLLILLGIISLSPMALFVFISPDNNSIRTLFLYKFIIPLFLSPFIIFGFGFNIFIYIFNGNKDNILSNYYQTSMECI